MNAAIPPPFLPHEAHLFAQTLQSAGLARLAHAENRETLQTELLNAVTKERDPQRLFWLKRALSTVTRGEAQTIAQGLQRLGRPARVAVPAQTQKTGGAMGATLAADPLQQVTAPPHRAPLAAAAERLRSLPIATAQALTMAPMHDQNDTTTPQIASGAMTRIYEALLERPGHDPKTYGGEEAIRQVCLDAREHFRQGPNAADFMVKSALYATHAYHFVDKTWRQPPEVLRAYVTVRPELAGKVPALFAATVAELRAAGVTFNGKAANPDGALRRLDNMVFYIEPKDAAKAAPILERFANASGAPSGMATAIPGRAPGLCWARDVSANDAAIFRQAVGGKSAPSYSQWVALRLAPGYLERIAGAHRNGGRTGEAAALAKELVRLKKLGI
ncbi:MAG: hypothetical protein IT381_22145 [Deltaproteobacteria bacterium]|nr:hypothetical protein [Deltaproteobacteria bacterium]